MPKAAAEKKEKPAKEPKAKKEKEPKEKKEKKEKDPNAPKKNLGAYMWFCADKRPEVKKENPDWGITQIAKHLGEEWRGISDKDKAKYEKQAEEDKARYQKELEAYNKKKDK